MNRKYDQPLTSTNKCRPPKNICCWRNKKLLTDALSCAGEPVRSEDDLKPVSCCVLAVLVLIGCGDLRYAGEFELDEQTFDADAMQMIVEDSGLTIPKGARGLNFRYSSPIDSSFVARVEIPQEARDSMLKQIDSIQNEDINISGGPGEKVDWWPPPRESIIVDRQCRHSDGDYFRAALTDEDHQVILYVNHAIF